MVILTGYENYTRWARRIGTILDSEGILYCVNSEPTRPVSATEQLRVDKAFAIIFQSLSETIQATLPFSIRDWTSPSPKALWEEVRHQHSAPTGLRQAVLCQSLFRASVRDGDDPMPTLAAQRSAHAHLNSSGETMSDRILAFSMLAALPQSYSALTHDLSMRQQLASDEVVCAVGEEFQRRKHREASTAKATVRSSTALQQRGFRSGFKQKDFRAHGRA